MYSKIYRYYIVAVNILNFLDKLNLEMNYLKPKHF